MSKFKFRLKTVLAVKEIEEKQVMSDLAEVNRSLDIQSEALREIQNRSEVATDAIVNEVTKGIRAFELKGHFTFKADIEKKLELQSQIVDKILAEKNEMISIYEKVHHEIETIDDLKKRQLFNFKKNIDKKEDNTTEEYVLFKHFTSMAFSNQDLK